MKPLLIMVTYNRKTVTALSIASLMRTMAFEQAEVVIFDNGSMDGTTEMLKIMINGQPPETLEFHPENIGCPRALNWVMKERRKPGQAVIKVDNDVQLVTPGWVRKLDEFSERYRDVAMVGPWYDGMADGRHSRYRGDEWVEVFPLMGHCVYHAGWFLDKTGYFDVLSEDHLYGFEDLLMCHRAAAMRYRTGAMKDIFLLNLQRHNSLDVGRGHGANHEGRNDHVARLRPLYNHRVSLIRQYGSKYVVNESGKVGV